LNIRNKISFKRIVILETIILILLIILLIQCKTQNNNSQGLLSQRIYNGIIEPKSYLIFNLNPLEDKIQEIIDQSGGHVAVYIVNLRDGASIGINENEPFEPASLGKLTVAIAIMKEVERGNLRLNQELPILEKDRTFISSKLSETNQNTITVRDALEMMLKESDNTAFNVLNHYIKTNDVVFINKYLDPTGDNFSVNEDGTLSYNDFATTPKYITNLFTSLYLSTLLEYKDSEFILELLNNPTFDIRDIAQIPDDVKIVQKFGIYIEKDGGGLHDCGIMYIEESRIAYCVMTKNMDPEKAARVIGEIVKVTYIYIQEIRNELDDYSKID